MDPFQVWLLWFSGWFSKLKKGTLFWKITYILYWTCTGYFFWVPVSVILVVTLNNKLYLFCLLVPIIVTHLFRSIGHAFLTYDILNDENLLDTLWATQLVGGIVSTKKNEHNLNEICIWSHSWRDWRDGLLKNFELETINNEDVAVNDNAIKKQ
ncbi:MAG: hypothetical protein PHR42_01305 [Caldisericia bacterium]|nr:hypothetical protein [Caldisericia bacterium]